MKYSEKLKDPRWQKKRLKILERDEFTCQICLNDDRTLHVHHRRYEGNKDPWNYDDDLLITLCENCHESERELRPESERILLRALKLHFFEDDLHRLAIDIENSKLEISSFLLSDAIGWIFLNNDLQNELCKKFLDYCKSKGEG